MTTLSIAMISHLASPAAPTGAERSLALLARGLAERGHRVAVAAPGPWGLAAELRQAGVELRSIPVRACWLAYPEPLAPGVAALKWLKWRLPDAGRRRLVRWIGALSPDVVHVNCLPALSAAQAARSTGRPVVWHVREILPEGRRARWWRARLRRCASRTVAVSEATAAWLRAGSAVPGLAVVHNGIDPAGAVTDAAAARSRLGLPPAAGECVVGLVGQLVPHKGPLEFVRAARQALTRAPSLRFLLAGDGPAGFVSRVRREIAAGAFPERFHLLGPQPSGAQPIAACDVVCLTTLSPDPLPRTILESMRAGRVVAAFRSGGTPELIADGESGLLVEPGDTGALSGALVRLAADPRLRARLGEAARRRAVRQFSLDRHVERMEAVLLATARAAREGVA